MSTKKIIAAIRKWLIDLWWRTGIPGRLLMEKIAEGTLANMRLLGELSVELRSQWEAMSLEQRKAELGSVLRHHSLIMDGREDEATKRVEWLMETHLGLNPELNLTPILFQIIICRRMDVKKRQKLSRRGK